MVFSEKKREELRILVQESDDYLAFNTALAKELRKLKKDLGAKSVKQNYRGTGSQKFRRQLYVNFEHPAAIDLWLKDGYVGLGGVLWIRPNGKRDRPWPTKVPYLGSVQDTYEAVRKALAAWLDGSDRPSS